jgi:hypothetical protein
VSWSSSIALHRAAVGHQGHRVAVHRHRRGPAYTWATLQVTRRNPSAVWTSALARIVAADLAARGWRLERVMSDNASEFRSTTFGQTIAASTPATASSALAVLNLDPLRG